MSESVNAKRLLLVGESWTTHMIHQKGFDTFTSTEYVEGAGPFLAALRSRGWQVDHIPSHELEARFPVNAAGLADYDVVVLSDVGANTFQLTRAVFAAGRREVDRLALLAQWVRDGGGLMMVGGYLSFSGIDAKARYGSTVIADLLPVHVLDRDDRCEVPDGAVPVSVAPHPALDDGGGSWPHVLGYNETRLREGSTLLATVRDDPFIAVRHVDHGRSAVFTSDMSAHWAPTEFTDWSGYAGVWHALATWVSGDDAVVTPRG